MIVTVVTILAVLAYAVYLCSAARLRSPLAAGKGFMSLFPLPRDRDALPSAPTSA
jgi:hypothetical protein